MHCLHQAPHNVNAAAQVVLKKAITEYLTEEEVDLCAGPKRTCQTSGTPVIVRAEYNAATALEALLGYCISAGKWNGCNTLSNNPQCQTGMFMPEATMKVELISTTPDGEMLSALAGGLLFRSRPECPA